MKIQYHALPTEKINSKSSGLDQMTTESIVKLMNGENSKIPAAIHRVEKKIVQAVRLVVQSVESGGRIFFVGAGTSGRLGVLESAELPPTFSTPPSLAQSLMAGGKIAVFRSQEGAEDNIHEAAHIIKSKIKKKDIVIGIAASGVTPFVQGALHQAKKMRAKTILVTCNPQGEIGKSADVVIAPSIGPEMIAGSTRLRAGTATKMILNMLTTISMVQLGKVYGNLMVDLQPRSKKLRERGIRLVEELTGLSKNQAAKVLVHAKWNVKTAVVMAKKNLSLLEAAKLLKRNKGFLRKALMCS